MNITMNEIHELTNYVMSHDIDFWLAIRDKPLDKHTIILLRNMCDSE